MGLCSREERRLKMRPLRYASDGQMPARSSIGYDRVVGSTVVLFISHNGCHG